MVAQQKREVEPQLVIGTHTGVVVVALSCLVELSAGQDALRAQTEGGDSG